MKFLRPISLLALVVALAIQAGCDPNGIGLNSGTGDSANQQNPNVVDTGVNGSTNGATPRGDGNSNLETIPAPQLIIGSFNIQMFGKAKMAKPGVVEILTDIVRRFDVLAIQELRDVDQVVIPEFLKLINEDGSTYAAAVGPRQGYSTPGQTTRYFEQSVYIYDTNKVELLAPTYAAYDQYRLMHRPPYVAHFRCRQVPPEQAFSFVLMNVHIDPDDTAVEFEALKEIIGTTYANHRGEDDFILLGDMNEEPHKYQQYQWMRSQRAMLPSEVKTNTVGTAAYDNLVFDSGYTSEFLNQAGAMNLMEVYGLTLPQAQLVSDHFPVWGVFSALESPRAEVTQGVGTTVRR